ncbi:endonuclease/exonuclease/phosphatase family protein [Mucilaginibacter arboris]|uniref:Endonuclease n=1 Tax=Mucilaginibacter arboris TaxID=2682090 RepID=A0A7K1SWJ7_9SPHI|nr:endonuclease/exonuclease/phosphatase family protein [Mucilaginibacter arboris]MVN21663.1 endonuclease [Mucilaginibacter arboris]
MPAKNKPVKKLPFLDKVVLFFTVLASISILLSLLASLIDPRTFWQLAFFGLAYPPLLIANIILVLYWFIRFSKLIFIPLISILLGWSILVKSFNINTASSDGLKASPDYLRLMTYNVHGFMGVGENNTKPTRTEILQLINDEQPDVICIPEFFTRKKGKFAMIDSLEKVLHTSYFDTFAVDNINFEGSGVAAFSKYPIVNKGFIQLSDKNSTNQCIFIDVKKANQIIRVYAVHLQSINFQPQDYQIIDSVAKAKESSMNSYKRIMSKLKKAFLKRSEQVYLVKDHANKSPYPFVIAGDFNDTPASFAVNKMSAGLINAFQEKGNGFGATYNGDFPNYQIDYILAAPKFKVINYKVFKKKLSDHYAIRADLLLK